MAGAGMNNIKARIKSVKSTMQITGAMELVATSKLRRAKEKVERTRPFYTTLGKAIDEVIATAEITDSVYTRDLSEGARTLFIVIAGDRGLAGGYNANVYRLTEQLMKEGDLVLPVGKKACEHYKSRGVEYFGEPVGYVSDLDVGDALALGDSITEAFVEGCFDRVVTVYTRFVSMMTQTPVFEQLLPLERDCTECSDAPEFDIDPEEMLAAIVPKYVGGIIYSAVCEALASESGARRSAMNAANKNAKEMIDDLMLRYNRARQSIITQEITEIVSGAEAL